MRTIIAGSRGDAEPRSYTPEQYEALEDALSKCGWIPSVVLSGCARGVDMAGEAWAKKHMIPIETFPPDFGRFGRSRAPMIRNGIMAQSGEALIAIWDGQSPGTQDMINRAIRHGLKIYVWREDEQ